MIPGLLSHLFIVGCLYAWDDYHPTLDALRHVRGLKGGRIPPLQTSKSIFALCFPSTGLAIRIFESAVRTIAKFCLRRFLSPFALTCLIDTLSTPFELAWIRAVVYDQPFDPEQSIKSLRSVTLQQWVRFIVVSLGFVLLNEAEGSFLTYAWRKTYTGNREGIIYELLEPAMSHLLVFVSMTLATVVWSLRTVATVQAVVDHPSTPKFWTRMASSLWTIPSTLWRNFFICQCVGIFIGLMAEPHDGLELELRG